MLQGRFCHQNCFLNVEIHSSLSEGLLKTINRVACYIELFLWLNIAHILYSSSSGEKLVILFFITHSF